MVEPASVSHPAVGDCATYEEFFPFYVGQHSKPATRWFHFVGTHMGIAAGLIGIARRRPRLLGLAPVLAYGMAWLSHFAIEGNKPATFGHPLWAIRGDFQMISMMWRGRNAELTHIAADSRHLTVEQGEAA